MIFFPKTPPPPISKSVLRFGRLPGFARFFFWEKQHLDTDEFKALVDLYLQGKRKNELLGEKPVQVPLWSTQNLT